MKLRGIDRMAGLPPLRLTCREFESLPEYSGSKPTGVTHGKRWRRLDGAHDPSCPKELQAWIICEYDVMSVHPDRAISYKTLRYRPVLQVRASIVP